MRLVSLNAWGGQVWPALGDWAAGIRADILCLQEVTRAPVPSPGWLRYRDAFRDLNQRSDLLADISRRLPDHRAHFAPAVRGSLEDAQGKTLDSEHGIAFWSYRGLAISALFQGFAHGRYREGGWGAEPVPRAIQVARATLHGNRSFLFAHLHGLRDPEGKHDTPAREEQAKAIVAAIETLRDPGEPVILAGDLNLLPGSATFAELARIGLSDLVTGQGFDDTRTRLYPKPQRFADYMLVTPGIHVRRFDIPAMPEVSDHRPLVLDFDV